MDGRMDEDSGLFFFEEGEGRVFFVKGSFFVRERREYGNDDGDAS